MEVYKLFGFLEILKKSIKITPRNGRLMAIVTSVFLIISSLFFIWNISAVKPIMVDFITKSVTLSSLDPQGPLFMQALVSVQEDIRAFLGVELIYFLGLFMTSVFAQTAIILLTGVSYSNKKILAKDLMVRMPQSSIRLFITSFYVTLLRVGLIYFGLIVIMVPTIMVSGHLMMSKVMLWVLVISVVSLFLYLAVVWVMSLVISVLEECSGIEALGKAGRLAKGKKLEGFSLNLVFNLLSYVFLHALFKTNNVKFSELTHAFLRFVLMSCVVLVVVLEYQVYTVFYLECKKSHGEEIELQGSVEYSKIPNVPLVSEDLP